MTCQDTRGFNFVPTLPSEPQFTYNVRVANLNKKTRAIFHMDGDAFFVGCEIAKNPKLRGLPVVTGEERGIATALSQEAKALGLSRGAPVFKIKKDFPQVIILPGDYKSYSEYSTKMFDIVRRYADDVEEYSIDECFADLTGLDRPLGMTYLQIVERIKKEINQELDLSISLGIAPTKCLAKLASKWQKPNGLTVITPETAKEFLGKTPIEKVWGIGGRTSEALKNKDIQTALDFAEKDIEWIKRNFSKPFEVIWHELNCTLVMKVDPAPKTEYSSMQRTRTFHPATNDREFLLSQFSKNIEEVSRKARHYELVPKSISFFLKTQTFRYKSFALNLETPTNTPETLISLVFEHFNKIFTKGVLYRTTGVSLHELVPESAKQGDLFGGSLVTNKFEIIHKQIDSLEEKFSKQVLYLGSTHKARTSKVRGTDLDDLDRDLLFL